ncbi:uncharacterized protein LOC133285971 [Gastrolobium bilobum]|uniref:uncharacterized protein LOC133285971 n=1 Tax=Gastrolobium bilobum TaxID=150636 RepID=UPI002AB0CBE4|nr:uncharacterized protein LOC133285971 [Gastrolobium bilobum]
MVMAWIQRSISESIVKSIIWIEHARDAWLDLQERFSQGDVFRISDLMEETFRLNQGDRSVTDYYTHLKTVWDELDNLKPLPNCVCVVPCVCGAIARMREYREQEQVIRFLRRLNDQFASVRSQIMLISPLPNINRSFSLVSQQERQFKLDNHVTDANQSSVFNVTNRRGGPSYGGRFNGRGRGRNFGGRSQTTRICTHCGRNNHTIETCYQLHGFPPGYRNNNRISNTNAASTDPQNFNQDVSVASNSESYMHMTRSEYQQLMELLQKSPSTGLLSAPATNHVSNMAQDEFIRMKEKYSQVTPGEDASNVGG